MNAAWRNLSQAIARGAGGTDIIRQASQRAPYRRTGRAFVERAARRPESERQGVSGWPGRAASWFSAFGDFVFSALAAPAAGARCMDGRSRRLPPIRLSGSRLIAKTKTRTPHAGGDSLCFRSRAVPFRHEMRERQRRASGRSRLPLTWIKSVSGGCVLMVDL